jgi:hypothetical protein
VLLDDEVDPVDVEPILGQFVEGLDVEPEDLLDELVDDELVAANDANSIDMNALIARTATNTMSATFRLLAMNPKLDVDLVLIDTSCFTSFITHTMHHCC